MRVYACVCARVVKGWYGGYILHFSHVTTPNKLLQVNKAFADKFAAVERLKDGM